MDEWGSVVHMFKEAVAANMIRIEPNDDDFPCNSPFCIQLEFYGKDLGWYTLFIQTIYHIAKLQSWTQFFGNKIEKGIGELTLANCLLSLGSKL